MYEISKHDISFVTNVQLTQYLAFY